MWKLVKRVNRCIPALRPMIASTVGCAHAFLSRRRLGDAPNPLALLSVMRRGENTITPQSTAASRPRRGDPSSPEDGKANAPARSSRLIFPFIRYGEEGSPLGCGHASASVAVPGNADVPVGYADDSENEKADSGLPFTLPSAPRQVPFLQYAGALWWVKLQKERTLSIPPGLPLSIHRFATLQSK